MKASQVPLDISSLNRFDSFILDGGKGRGVMVFRPRGTNRFEKIKATAVANDIKNEDHAGKGRVEIFDESENDNMSNFFAAFGSGSLAEVSNVEIDDKSTDYKPKLLQLTRNQWKIMNGPLNQDLFSSNSCYLLLAGPTGLFLWHGRLTSKQLRKTSSDSAQQYIRDNNMSKDTRIDIILEGLETAAFKQFFPNWQELIDRKGWKSVIKSSVLKPAFSGPESIKSVADWSVRSLHQRKQLFLDKTAGQAVGFCPDNGMARKTIWRVENFNLVEVKDITIFPRNKPKTNSNTPSLAHQSFLYSGDSYVILYQYGAGDSIVYFWQGEQSSTDERGASALQAFRIAGEQTGGRARQIRVEQGSEPTHLLRIFGGSLITLAGGKASGFRNRKDKESFDDDGTMLFRVGQVGISGKEFRVEQVEETAASLDSENVFLLISHGNNFIWQGRDSTMNEAKEAERIGKLITGSNILVQKENAETPAFWSAMGGKKPYASSSLSNPKPAARLFTIVPSPSGRIRATEIFNYKQTDLDDRRVMMLDAVSVVYLWTGSRTRKSELGKAESLAKLYLDTDPSQRDSSNTKIVTCKRDEEPLAFKQIFPDWKNGVWGFNFDGK